MLTVITQLNAHITIAVILILRYCNFAVVNTRVKYLYKPWMFQHKPSEGTYSAFGRCIPRLYILEQIPKAPYKMWNSQLTCLIFIHNLFIKSTSTPVSTSLSYSIITIVRFSFCMTWYSCHYTMPRQWPQYICIKRVWQAHVYKIS